MKDQGRGPATYVVPWAPHLLNWALCEDGLCCRHGVKKHPHSLAGRFTESQIESYNICVYKLKLRGNVKTLESTATSWVLGL